MRGTAQARPGSRRWQKPAGLGVHLCPQVARPSPPRHRTCPRPRPADPRARRRALLVPHHALRGRRWAGPNGPAKLPTGWTARKPVQPAAGAIPDCQPARSRTSGQRTMPRRARGVRRDPASVGHQLTHSVDGHLAQQRTPRSVRPYPSPRSGDPATVSDNDGLRQHAPTRLIETAINSCRHHARSALIWRFCIACEPFAVHVAVGFSPLPAARMGQADATRDRSTRRLRPA
jgi:hypothetical protein